MELLNQTLTRTLAQPLELALRIRLTTGFEPASQAGSEVERVTRIELAFSAWEADVLPLNYARK